MRSVLYPLFTNLWLWIFIYISSLVPFKSGSIFEYIILPLILGTFFIENLLSKSGKDKTLLLIISFIFIITFQTLLLFFLRASLGMDITILTIRIAGMITIYYLSINSLIFKIKSKFLDKSFSQYKTNKFESFKYFPFFALVLVLASIFKAIKSQYFIGIDFPLYTQDAVNRQIYSPAVMLLSLYLLESLPTKLSGKNFFINNQIIFISALLSMITAVLSGSRSWFLILAAYIIAKTIQIILKNKFQVFNFILHFNLKVKFKDFIFFTIISSSILYICFYIRNIISIEKIELIFKRLNTISLLIFNYSNDASRGEMIAKSLSIFSDPLNNLFGNLYPSFSKDSAAVSIISNYGLIMFIFLAIILFIIAKKYSMQSLTITFSIIIFIIFGGLIFITPRVYLLWFAALNFSILSKLNSNKLKELT